MGRLGREVTARRRESGAKGSRRGRGNLFAWAGGQGEPEGTLAGRSALAHLNQGGPGSASEFAATIGLLRSKLSAVSGQRELKAVSWRLIAEAGQWLGPEAIGSKGAFVAFAAFGAFRDWAFSSGG